MPEVTIEEKCRIRRCIIDKGCVIPAGTQIGFNSEEDRQRFYVTDNGVVLVTPDMLGQSVHYVR